MNIRKTGILIPLAALLMASACEKESSSGEEKMLFRVCAVSPEVRISFGDSVVSGHPFSWAAGEQIRAGELLSEPLSVVDTSSNAEFFFKERVTAPANILSPADCYADESTITIPSSVPFDRAVPMAARIQSGSVYALMKPLTSVVRVPLKLASARPVTDRLLRVEVSAEGAVLHGDFTVDYGAGTLTLVRPGANPSRQDVVLDTLLSADPLDVYVCVPEGEYALALKFRDVNNHVLTLSLNRRFTAGEMYSFPETEFIPTATEVDADIEDGLVPEGRTAVVGKVCDAAGSPLEGVVVSDGLSCVKTASDGSYTLVTDLEKAAFVYVAFPSGYFPQVSGGLPVFYQTLARCGKEGSALRADFTLERTGAPSDSYSLFLSADLQPYVQTSSWNRIAFNSYDIVQEIYADWDDYYKVKSAEKKVYGIHMGDVTSDRPDLFPQYREGLAKQQYPTFNVIGNHDIDIEQDSLYVGVSSYESCLGPVNCSFNMGKLHYIICNDIVFPAGADGKRRKSDYYRGLTDDTWAWIKSDLSAVDRNSVIMFCAHGSINGRTDGHLDSLRLLLSQYKHTWGWYGHEHSLSFSDDGIYSNIEHHVVGRTTGPLRYCEWQSGGIPRGYLVVDVEGESLSWYYKPLARYASKWCGGLWSSSSVEPDRTWRPFQVVDDVAVKDGKTLSPEALQYTVYPPASNPEGNIWLNVYLYDSHWSVLPTFSPEGSSESFEFTRQDACDICAASERAYYDSTLTQEALDKFGHVGNPVLARMFCLKPAQGVRSGTVTVTDRFGRKWTQSIAW